MSDDYEIDMGDLATPFADPAMNRAYHFSMKATAFTLKRSTSPGQVEELIMRFLAEDGDNASALVQVLADTFIEGSTMMFGTGDTPQTVGDPRMLIRTPEDDAEIEFMMRDHPVFIQNMGLVARKEAVAISRQASEDSLYLVRESADRDTPAWTPRVMEVLNDGRRCFAVCVFLVQVVSKLYMLNAIVHDVTHGNGQHDDDDSDSTQPDGPPAGGENPPGDRCES